VSETPGPLPHADLFGPEFYADQVQIGTNPWGFIFRFGLATEEGGRPIATVRMSPHHAKVMALMLKRIVRQWEEQMGQTIEFSDQIVRDLDLPDDL
jgi:hypothetical protein